MWKRITIGPLLPDGWQLLTGNYLTQKDPEGRGPFESSHHRRALETIKKYGMQAIKLTGEAESERASVGFVCLVNA